MTPGLEYIVRPISLVDEPFLWEMLYQALYVSPGSPPFPREVVNHPEIRRYVESWGQPHDLGFIAIEQTNRQSIGAAWIRLLKGENKGYGHVDDQTPELTIAVAPEHRGKGVGVCLLQRLFEAAEALHSDISLSVSQDNPALRLYQRLGFEVVGTSGTSLTMIKRLIR